MSYSTNQHELRPATPRPWAQQRHGHVRSDPNATPPFRGVTWRVGNALVATLARLGLGPIALLTTTGRRTGRPHTVPVVPIDHQDRTWLVAPYGPVGWVHNVLAEPTVTLRYGRRRSRHRTREVGADEAGPVLKRYVAVATRARRHFDVAPGAPTEAFVAEAAGHPVFELRPDHGHIAVATTNQVRNAATRSSTTSRAWSAQPPPNILAR